MGDERAVVRRLARQHATTRSAFHDAIRAAIDAGWSLRQVAEDAGMSHVGVAKIVKRAKD